MDASGVNHSSTKLAFHFFFLLCFEGNAIFSFAIVFFSVSRSLPFFARGGFLPL